MTRARLASLLALALLLPACGGESAEDVLAVTADRLGEIRSGTLDMSLRVSPHGDAEPFGFELRGPFDLGTGGKPPSMRIEYTQIANGQEATVTLVATREQAYVETEAGRVPLDPAALRLGSVQGDLEELLIGDWVTDAEASDGEDGTDRVTGKLDIVAVVNDLVGLARGFGRDLRPVEGPEAEQLRRATRATGFELDTGKDDRLLRRLVMEADFGLDAPEELRDALGELVGAKVTFRLGVEGPNEPVDVGG